MKRMEQASASLFANYDKGSTFSRRTDNLSKLSWIFDFDSAPLNSGPYERVSRLTMKYALRWPRTSAKEQNSGRPVPHFREYPVRMPEASPRVQRQRSMFPEHRNWSTEAVCCDEDRHVEAPSGLILVSHPPNHSPDARPRNKSPTECIIPHKLSHDAVTWKSHYPIPQIITYRPDTRRADLKAIRELFELDAVETKTKIIYELDAVDTEISRSAAVERQKAEVRKINLQLADQLMYLRWEQDLLMFQQNRYHHWSWWTNNY